MNSDTIQRANAHALPQLFELLQHWLPGGRLEGREYKVGSLQGGQGRSLSVNVDTGLWADFASNERGGDPVSLLAAIQQCPQFEAAKNILGEDAMERGKGGVLRPKPKKDVWTPLPFALQPNLSFVHPRKGPAARWWEYRTAENKIAGYAVRFEFEDGSKDVLPMCWARHGDGREQYRWMAMGEPRPLWNLPAVLAGKEKTIVVVEGEKAAEALTVHLEKLGLIQYVVTTWSGGGKAVARSDWSVVAGRNFILWPDRDRHAYIEKNAPLVELAGTEKPWGEQAGFQAMVDAARAIGTGHFRMMPVETLEDTSDGWDAYDAIQQGMDVAWLLNGAVDYTPVLRPAEKMARIAKETPSDPRRLGNLPFLMLGVSAGGLYHYMPDNGGQMVALKANSHIKTAFFQLAPIDAWFNEFGIHWDQVASVLINRQQMLPKFDPRRIRGRGCYIDGPDVVYHAGDCFIVNGERQSRYNSPTKRVYPLGLEIPVPVGEALSDAEAARLLSMCRHLSWKHSIFGDLLAGWLALAPICGALHWVPHLWLTGASGAGKSWIMAHIIEPLLGEAMLSVRGTTSEAGIRGPLGSDALPVLFDEAEVKGEQSARRIDNVLELARQASSETGASISKGTADGGFVQYLIRSAFLFASVNVSAVNRNDTSRVTVLNLLSARERAGKKNLFTNIQKEALETALRAEWAAAFRARSVQNAKLIRKNAETFAREAAGILGDARTGDQIGTLLAGAMSLGRMKEYTQLEAREILMKKDLSQFRPGLEDSDECRCLNHLMASMIREDQGTYYNSVQTLLRKAMDELGQPLLNGIEEPDASARAGLVNIGIKVLKGADFGKFVVANNHPALTSIFKDTPWADGKWKDQLVRLPGAAVTANSIRFGSFVIARGVILRAGQVGETESVPGEVVA